MRLTIILIISFLTLLFTACKDEINESNINTVFFFDSLSVEEISELILGKWEWTHSILMSRNIHPPDNLIYPEEAGYSMQRFFEGNNTVTFLINNQFAETYSYEIKKFKVIPNDKGYVTEIFINGYPSKLTFSHPDKMMIGNGWSDGIDEYFVKSD